MRRVVTGALEIERAKKTIGSSLEAAPIVHVTDGELFAALDGVDLADHHITSGIRLRPGRRRTGPSFSMRSAASTVVPGLAVASNAPARGVSRTMSAPIRNFRTCRRATRLLRELRALGRI